MSKKFPLTIKSRLSQFSLMGHRVFLRVDANVPIKDGKIINDYRLKAILPTIKVIQKKGGKVILATHIGRPKKISPSLSTKILIPWFEKHGLTIDFASDIQDALEKSHKKNTSIVLLENVRFFPEEKQKSKTFAKKLASLGDFFVQDAFGVCHRDDTSVTLLPQMFPPEYRTIGPLVDKEIKHLNNIIETNEKPFIIVLGGGKVHDKIMLIKNMFSKATTILLCPAIVLPFLKAKNESIGKSEINHEDIDLAKMLIQTPHADSLLQYPLDYLIAEDTIMGSLSNVDEKKIPSNGLAVAIGEKTIKKFTKIINDAQTVFFNCAMGFRERPETLKATKKLLEALAKSPAYTVVGGGDSVALLHSFGLESKIDYISTGGGASLAYLSGQVLPGLSHF